MRGEKWQKHLEAEATADTLGMKNRRRASIDDRFPGPPALNHSTLLHHILPGAG